MVALSRDLDKAKGVEILIIIDDMESTIDKYVNKNSK